MMARSSVWRNLAICGHASAGKTTLVDRLLAESGACRQSPTSQTKQVSVILMKKRKLMDIQSNLPWSI